VAEAADGFDTVFCTDPSFWFRFIIEYRQLKDNSVTMVSLSAALLTALLMMRVIHCVKLTSFIF
jgi:hypothetical protein